MSHAPEEKLAAALAEFLDRQAREENPSVESFLLEYPDLAHELRPAIEAVAEIDRAVAIPTALAPPLPERLSGHRILAEIGSGGMGSVYLAEDERLGRKVAIKMLGARLASDPALRERFMQEARAMARLTHPDIVRIYSLGPADEPPHFVMEYLEGARLTEAARRLPVVRKAELMHRVVLAVGFLHANHVLHRDLKPANILVGFDLEPKLLDFGLALDTGGAVRALTQPGQTLGTPDYASPEQASAEALDERSDIFSLGVILYELLTGQLPDPAGQDPVLPRRLNPDVPGDLQNICLKALEKNRADRYASAREMAADLERFLAGEPVLAAPAAYARLMAGKVGEHLEDLENWHRDRILSEAEYDSLRKGYDRLVEREDAWILEARRLTLQQVSLYLGGWLLVIGAALIVLFRYPSLHGITGVLLAVAAAGPALWIGLRLWRREQHRLALAFLLAFCLLLPVTLLAAMTEYNLFAAASRGREDLELFSKLPDFRRTSNAQLWWAILLSLPAYYWLRRFTGSTVFTLVIASFGALWCVASLLRLGLIEWLDKDPGRPYFYLIPCAFGFLAAGLLLERTRRLDDSRYLYPFFVVLTYVAFSGLAAYHEPYAKWLDSMAPWTRGQKEYLFLINAVFYFGLQQIFEIPSSSQLRAVARAFRFVIPGHVMLPLLLLGLAASTRWTEQPGCAGCRFEARLFEVLLPIVASAFVFASIPKQMKNYFASGLVFLAIGAVRLQQDLLKDRALWPAALIVVGLMVMLAAARYSPLKVRAARLLRRTNH